MRERPPDALDEAADAIARLCGCPSWDYPGQLVRDVEGLVNERDRLRAGIVRFYVAHGPHLSASWQEHFRELLGDDLPRLGLRR